jgi:hypothetical protein
VVISSFKEEDNEVMSWRYDFGLPGAAIQEGFKEAKPVHDQKKQEETLIMTSNVVF